MHARRIDRYSSHFSAGPLSLKSSERSFVLLQLTTNSRIHGILFSCPLLSSFNIVFAFYIRQEQRTDHALFRTFIFRLIAATILSRIPSRILLTIGSLWMV